MLLVLFISSCTEETRNQWFRQADNILGKDLRVSYVDNGVIVKTWIVRDSKITTGKDEQGQVLGYYYFWDEKIGYVQTPIVRTIIEELRD